MVDELVMPEPKDHTKWAGELQQMKNYLMGQPGHQLLWISIAGISNGKLEHFEHSYLSSLMRDFHLPVMTFPLRNTKEVIKLAGLDSNDTNKVTTVIDTNSPGHAKIQTNPSYTLPPNLMSGVQCVTFKVKKDDNSALHKAVESASKEMMERTAEGGFHVLCDSQNLKDHGSLSTVEAAVQNVVGAALLYTYNGGGGKDATEAEVEEWLRRRKRGEEKRALVTDQSMSRGWEAPSVLVIKFGGKENMVMRSTSFCALIEEDSGSTDITS